jgi:hypothetical protein
MQIANALAPKLATVQELFLDFVDKACASTPWHRFLELFHSIKILRLHRRIAVDIAPSLEHKHGESAVVLPSLEEIELRSHYASHITEDQRRSDLAAFEPFVATRQQSGIPVKVSWRTAYYAEFKFQGDLLNEMSEWHSYFGAIHH